MIHPPTPAPTRWANIYIGDYNDPRLLAQLAERADVVTYEFENVPADVAEFLASHTQVHPSPEALAVAQDRLIEKSFFHDLDIPYSGLCGSGQFCKPGTGNVNHWLAGHFKKPHAGL